MRRVWCVVLVSLGFGVGCASGKVKGDEGPMHPPPESSERPALPSGPKLLEEGPSGAPMREEVDAQREGDDRVVRREVLRMLQQRGPAYILGQVQVQAVKDVRGKFAGYMVVAVTAQAREVLGGALKEGDVITHLNGVRQRMPEDYLAAWKLLGTAEQVRIDFIREDALVAAVWRVEP